MNTGVNERLVRPDARVMSIDPATVLIPERIGFYHEDKAAALGRLIAVDGQRDPIKVVSIEAAKNGGKSWRLVVGMHRLMGCQIEGVPALALEVFGKAEQLADLEASENLHRRPLGPIERAKFVAALVQAAKDRLARMHPDASQEELAVKARWDRNKQGEQSAESALSEETEDTCSNLGRVYGWEESVRDAFGFGRSEIYRCLAVYHLIIEPFPELCEPLSRHPVVGENASQLKKITQVKDQAARRRVIKALLDDPEIKVEDAMIAVGVGLAGAEATPVAHQKHFDAIEGGWSRLSIPHRRQFLPKIRAMLTADMKRELRDMLNQEVDA